MISSSNRLFCELLTYVIIWLYVEQILRMMMRFLDYTLHKSRRCHHQMTLIFPTTKFHFQTRLLTLRLSHLMRTWRICVFTAFATPMITQCWISEIFFDSQMRCGTVFHPLCKEMALKETRLRNIRFLLKFLPRRFAGQKLQKNPHISEEEWKYRLLVH